LDSHRVTGLEPGIVRLELTRPQRLNTLSSNAVAEAHREIDCIGGDPAIRMVILTGEGM
jgi:enoyl-CoA hydratase/carnithine racemase